VIGMPIQIVCPCGKRLAAKDELAGRRVKCPACAGILVVPKPVEEPQEDLYLLADEPVQKKVPMRPAVGPQIATTRAAPPPAVERESAPRRGRFLYLVMGLVLVPLIVSTFGWFCWQVETASRKFAGQEEDLAPAA
jgi:hypothetical protein